MTSNENTVNSPTGDSVAEAAPDAQQGASAPAAGPDSEPTIDSLSAELESVREEARANWERCLRTAAELDNVRKRAARDVEHANKFALERFAKEILSVRDSLEMGMTSAAGDEALKPFVDGMAMTLKSLDQALGKFGVEIIDPAGQKFDPELHEAMAAQPSDEVEADTVLNVVQKGFSLNGRLLRAARVIVAR